MHLGYLEGGFTNGIYWTIFDHLQGPDRLKFARFFGRIFETCVRRSFERSMPQDPRLARRLVPEFTYRSPLGERRTSDLVLLYLPTAIFVEAAASPTRFEATAVSGDLSAFEADVAKIILENARDVLTERKLLIDAGIEPLQLIDVEEIEISRASSHKG